MQISLQNWQKYVLVACVHNCKKATLEKVYLTRTFVALVTL